MKKLLSCLAMALAFSLSTPVLAAEATTNAVLAEDQVTYTYETTNPVTNGRVAVTFNENEMTLVSAESAGLFDVEDINKDVEAVEGMKTIYFAFASADAYTGEDIALTLVFEVAEGMEGKDITITTEIEEMDNGEEVAEVEDTTDVITVPAKEEPEDPENPEEPENPEKPGDSADTGDHSNIEIYLGLLVVALLAIVALVFKSKKTCK